MFALAIQTIPQLFLRLLVFTLEVVCFTENEIEIGEARILLDSGFKKSYRTVVLVVFDQRFRVGDRICMERCAERDCEDDQQRPEKS